ncbi:hypothetical protein BV898_00414 [Hypsibius exemplaris]|uniref:G-protein coupled receptors family 1 profile domain-containing protein n=1 Tax=Hypsibius exemplaris TaxID=2072580 RepID=A0A1W0XDB9_HYPEX|nr:hypothetical protein BV898_00414 [Hypsibius exemplaris]
MTNNSCGPGNTSISSIPSFCIHIEDRILALWFAVMIVLCVLAATFNVILLVILCRVKKHRSGTGLLIAHLLVTGILMSAHYLVHALLVYANDAWHITRHVHTCTVVHYLLTGTMYANSWTEAALGVNRFIATTCPHRYKSWTGRNITLAMIGLCWAIAFGTVLPMCFGRLGRFYASPWGQCTLQTTSTAGTWIMSVNTYVPYVSVSIAVTAVVGQILVRRFTQRYHTAVDPMPAPRILRQKHQQRVHNKRQLRVAGMLLLSFLFTVLCNLPLPVMVGQYYKVYMGNPLFRLWLRVGFLLQYLGTPLIFLVCNRDYRRSFTQIRKRRITPNDPSEFVEPRMPVHLSPLDTPV